MPIKLVRLMQSKAARIRNGENLDQRHRLAEIRSAALDLADAIEKHLQGPEGREINEEWIKQQRKNAGS
jgi:hypothetical protein